MSTINNYSDDFKEFTSFEPINDSAYSGKRPKKSKKKHGFAKKVGVIALSGVLFGGTAAGAFSAVEYFTGRSTLSASAENNSSSSSLLKATSVSSSTSATGSLDVSSIASAAMPSIVSITNKSVQEVNDYFSMFGYNSQSQSQEVESCGSGIIIGKNDSELLIVTNNHVIDGADTLSVCFVDNNACEAQIKGTDSDNDLAVIAVPLSDISDDTMSQIAVATIGDSSSLNVGEQVVAIGNALGYGQSVTTGIVSATDRTISTSTSEEETSETADTSSEATYIQTDAAINPGNSGGALLNMNGEVIGINSAKLASTEVEGMGYAIPMSRASSIIEDLMNQTTRSKVASDQQGTLGIQGVSVSSEIQQAYSIPAGVYVSDVTSGGAADSAGIAAKYVITAFDGKSISDISTLQNLLQYYSSGETVDVTVQVPGSNGYSEKTIQVTLGAASSSSTVSEDSQTETSMLGGFFTNNQDTGYRQ